MTEKQTIFVPLGGFLGAGKTTFMLAAAGMLREQGYSVACVTNDQGGGLVDSSVVGAQGLPFGEVSGGCFCCRFNELTDTLKELIARYQPDIILAEAVGSCTDLNATVIRPLLLLHGSRFIPKPLTVLIDPLRLEGMLAGNEGFSPEVEYIFRKQLEEASCLVLNKTDLVSSRQASDLTDRLRRDYPSARVSRSSARDGHGIDDWLDYISTAVLPPESHAAMELDYDIYADGEAKLGWMNASFTAEGEMENATEICRFVVEQLTQGCIAEGAEIAHLKLWAQDDRQLVKMSRVRNSGAVQADLHPDGPWRSAYVTFWLNARMEIDASLLQEQFLLVLESLRPEFLVAVTVRELECFSPVRPQPVYRMAGEG